MKSNRLLIDGKPVRKWLFARLSRTVVPGSGAIPVDRKMRAGIFDADDRRFIVLVQVEAFTLDHAMDRLQNELYPGIARREWEMLEELDPEHELAKLGKTHPLKPQIMLPAHLRVQ